MAANVKELQEAVRAVGPLVAELLVLLKDGWQLADVARFVAWAAQPEIREKFQAALEGCTQIPAEVRDISLEDAAALAPDVVEIVRQVVAAQQAGE